MKIRSRSLRSSLSRCPDLLVTAGVGTALMGVRLNHSRDGWTHEQPIL